MYEQKKKQYTETNEAYLNRNWPQQMKQLLAFADIDR